MLKDVCRCSLFEVMILIDVSSTATSVKREIMKSCFYCVMAVRKAATHTAINPRLPQYPRATGFVQHALQRYISISWVLIHRAEYHRCTLCATTKWQLNCITCAVHIQLIDLNMIYVSSRLCSIRLCALSLRKVVIPLGAGSNRAEQVEEGRDAAR